MRMIIKNKKTGKSYSVITKDSKKLKKRPKQTMKDFYVYAGAFSNYEDFKEYYEPIINDVAERIGCKPEDIAINFSNVEVHNDETPEEAVNGGVYFGTKDEERDYPYGWCDMDRWNEFTKKYHWCTWEQIFEDLGSYEFDVRLKNSPVKDSKEEEVIEKTTEKVEDKKATLSDEEIEQVKELLSLLPDIKQLIESYKKEEAEEDEEYKEAEEEEEVEDEDVLLETEEEEEFIDDEDYEEDFSEEDEEFHDSKASIDSIEKKVEDSKSSDKEFDVANIFDLRYKTQLKK